MLSRLVLACCICLAAAIAPAHAQFAKLETPTGPISAGPVLVVDAGTGEVLQQQNAGAPWHPASLAKLMTLYVVFEELKAGRLRLEDHIAFSSNASAMPQTKLGVGPGQSVTVEQAVRGLVVRSANDAAVALAERVSGNEGVFGQRMTATAQRLGMTASMFRNASGLPDAAQVTTARDLAVLAVALIRDFPQYYPVFATPELSYGRIRFERSVKFIDLYPGADGMKTGFICSSGFNLVASAVRGGRRLVGVGLGFRRADLRDEAVARLFDDAYGKKSGGAGQQLWQLANGGGAPGVVFGNGDCGVRYDFPGNAVWLGTYASEPAARSLIEPANAKLAEIDQGPPGREWVLWLARNQQGHYTRFASILADVLPARAQKLCDFYRKAGRFCVVKRPEEIVSPYSDFLVAAAAAR